MGIQIVPGNVTGYCLVCGEDLPVPGDENKEAGEIEIKQESVNEEDNVLTEETEFPPHEGLSNCLIKDVRSCSSNAQPDHSFTDTDFRTRDKSALATTGWSEDDKAVYHWFLIWLKVNLTKEKGKRSGDLRWNEESGKDSVVPFCLTCKHQLQSLVELQRKVEELEERIKDGIQDLKGKANSSETAFREKGIYKKDVRYGRVRKQFVIDFDKEACNVTAENTDPSKSGTKLRKSTRTKTAVRRYNLLEESGTTDITLQARTRPVILLSTYDKTSAEKCVQKKKVKQDLDSSRVNATQDVDSCDNTYLGDDGMSPDHDSDVSPKTRKRKRSTKQVSRSKSTRLVELAPYSDHDDIHCNENDNNEDNWGVKFPPKKSPLCPLLKPKPSRKRKVLENEEEDWTIDEGNEEDLLGEEEEDDEERDNSSDEETNGKRRVGRYVIDTEKRTLTYKSLEFRQMFPYSDNKYQCVKCNAEVEQVTNTRIRRHYLKNHSTRYACKQCEYRTDGSFKLKAHIRRVHDRLPAANPKIKVLCRFCDKPVHRSRQKDHEWTHKNEEERRLAIEREENDVPCQIKEGKQHQCDQCGRKFRTATILKEHRDYIHGSEEVRESKKELCPECGERFVCLGQHRRRVHGVDSRLYTCLEPGCGVSVKSQARLRRHKDAVHRKIRPHKCTLCPREFTNLYNLQSHMNLHNGIRPFQCEHCPSAFSTKGPLQRHVKTYHGEGPVPKRKPYTRGPTMLGTDIRKRKLLTEGKYLPPSALASWAAGREPTSHFPLGSTTHLQSSEEKHDAPG